MSLADAYVARRDDMRRFFRARLGADDEVEDLVQELYFKVQAAGVAEPIHNPPAYLYRLASNLMLDRLRQRRSAVARDADWRKANQATVGGEDVVDTPDAEAAVIARERLRKVVAALETLAPLTRRVMQLHRFDGLSQGETAERLGISKSAVEKHVSLALGHLAARVGR